MDINLKRGDTAIYKINLKMSDGSAYTIKNNDTLVFGAKESYDDTTYAIHKVVKGSDTVTIEHEDTQKLEAGKYVYDIQITLGDTNQVCTPIEGKLTIISDVVAD